MTIYQTEKIDDKYSSWSKRLFGVLQGSILRPLFLNFGGKR